MKNIEYLKDLVGRIEKACDDMSKAETPQDVTALERAIHPVLKEIQMAAPRIWDDVNKASHARRREIAEGK